MPQLYILWLTVYSLENWDIHVRRQYDYRAPAKAHPYGDEEEPNAFRDFHIFTKIRVLHQLTVWSFWNPDWIRHLFPSDYKEVDQFLDWVCSQSSSGLTNH